MKRFAAFFLFYACAAAATPAIPNAIDREIAAYEAWIAEWPGRLYVSEDPQELLVGALLSRNPAAEPAHPPESFFRKALARDPTNTLILFDAANFCLRASAPTLCDQPLSSTLTELDSENGAAWTLRALESDDRGDRIAALAQLRRAATSRDFDGFFMRHMTLFDQTLQAWRTQSTAERFVQTIGFAAGIASQSVGILSACRERAATDTEWRHQCLQLGTAMERNGRIEWTVAIGQSLQIGMLELDPDTGALTAAEARQAARRADDRSRATDAWDALMTNDQFLNEYFTAFVNQGEEAARTLAKQRIRELADQPQVKQ